MTKRTVNGIQTAEEKMAWKKAFEGVLPGGRLSILDVGCGTGELSMLLAEMSHIVTGINLSESMVEKAREKNKSLRLNANFKTGDAEDLDFSDAKFNLVFNSHLLWTLPHPEKALDEWKRVIKNDGQIIIIDGYWRNNTLASRLKWQISGFGVLIFERKNPWKGWYTKEVRSTLPHPYGVPPSVAKEYLEKCKLRDIRITVLDEILEIHRRESPVWERIACDWPYYMIVGHK
jgi:ubiquinone/menaquinone biosynthesis C-methylase UbiE